MSRRQMNSALEIAVLLGARYAKVIFNIASDIRGSIGGNTYSRNASGSFIRRRVMPTQAITPARSRAKSFFGATTTGWKGLDEGDRAAWIEVAPMFPYTDKLGQVKTYTGQQLHNKWNNQLRAAGLSTIDSPIVDATVTNITSMAFDVDNGADTMALSFTPTPLPANMKFMVFMSTGLSPGISNPSRYMRFVTTLAAGVTSPHNLQSAWITTFGGAPIVGLKYFVAMFPVSIDSGQRGPEFMASGIAHA